MEAAARPRPRGPAAAPRTATCPAPATPPLPLLPPATSRASAPAHLPLSLSLASAPPRQWRKGKIGGGSLGPFPAETGSRSGAGRTSPVSRAEEAGPRGGGGPPTARVRATARLPRSLRCLGAARGARFKPGEVESWLSRKGRVVAAGGGSGGGTTPGRLHHGEEACGVGASRDRGRRIASRQSLGSTQLSMAGAPGAALR